jgi:hypothetical protein
MSSFDPKMRVPQNIFFIENAFSGFLLGNRQKIGVLETSIGIR